MDEVKQDIQEIKIEVSTLTEKVMSLTAQVTVLNDRFSTLGTIATDHEKRLRFLERAFFVVSGGAFILKMVFDAIK